MGKRREWPEELAKRCRAVGWTAYLAKSGHFKVQVPPREDLPGGGGFSFASTPGSLDSEKKALNSANRYGLERLELQARLLAEKERLERIERDRRENGVPEEDFTPDPESERDVQTESLGRIEVEGQVLEILEEAEAWFQPNRGGEPRLVEAARELLLSNHAVYFQCLKGTGTWEGETEVRCDRLFTSPQGVFVHQGRVHKAAENAAQRMQPHPDSQAAEAQEVAAPEPGTIARLDDLGQSLMALADQAGSLADFAERIHKDAAELAQAIAAEAGVSDELRAKAAKFDRMMGAIEP